MAAVGEQRTEHQRRVTINEQALATHRRQRARRRWQQIREMGISNPIISSMREVARQQREDKLKILAKPGEERDESDLKALLALTNKIDILGRMPLDLRMEVCKLLHAVKMPTGSVVFREGDEGDTFFMILSGSVVVTHTNQRTGRQMVLCHLYSGQSFGELAMQKADSLRVATVTVKQTCHFITLKATDFRRFSVLRKDDELIERVNRLKSARVFQGFEERDVSALAYGLTVKEVDRNTVVLKQGDENEDIFVVDKGSCKVIRKFPIALIDRVRHSKKMEAEHPVPTAGLLKTPEHKYFQVARLGPSDCFGEISALRRTKSVASVITEMKSTIFVVSRVDIMRRLDKTYFELLANSLDDGEKDHAIIDRHYSSMQWNLKRRELIQDIMTKHN